MPELFREDKFHVPFVGEEHVRHPNGLTQCILTHDGLFPVWGDIFEHKARIDETDL
jgi:hypothetical protein